MKSVLAGVIAIAIFAITVRCSALCHMLTPKSIRISDLSGQWFWVLATLNEMETGRDCSGFRGRKFNDTHMQFTVTDRPTSRAGARLGSVYERRVIIDRKDPNCCAKLSYAYQAAIVEKNFICFYFCQPGNLHDYAQCFSRYQDVTKFDEQRLYNGLRFFGLVLAESSLKRITRDHCKNFERDSLAGQPNVDPSLNIIREK